MKKVVLAPTNKTGDVVVHLPMEGFQVSDPGEAGNAPVRMASNVIQLETAIRTTLAEEQLEVALDDIDFQLTVSRCLLTETAEPQVMIYIPVQELNNALPPTPLAQGDRDQAAGELPGAHTGGKHTGELPDPDLDGRLADLFDLNEIADGESTHE